jgi:endonuclease/exonuclease/phosphatase family metal-dependent hydrolase
MKLVTWNTQWCCGNDGTVSPQRIVDGARALADFDVLCLQEISVRYPKLLGNPGHDQVQILRELLPGYQVFYGAAVNEWDANGRPQQFGNLIATRLPVAHVQHHPLPYPADKGVRSMPRMTTVVTVCDPALGAVRIMTTHLEFYSKPQRMAQAQALRALHMEACAQAAAPPAQSSDGSPFQSKAHTANAVLCGDFNLDPTEPEYAALQEPFMPSARENAGDAAIDSGAQRFWDGWRLLHGDAPHEPTFRLHDRTYGPVPIACDFVFVSDSLKDRLRSMTIDGVTQVSDHQPVAVELA